jgi:hypothetical protein
MTGFLYYQKNQEPYIQQREEAAEEWRRSDFIYISLPY